MIKIELKIETNGWQNFQAEGTTVDKDATMYVVKLGKRLPDDLAVARHDIK